MAPKWHVVLNSDPTMGGLVARLPRPAMPRRDPFVQTVRSIVAQQLSVHAIRAIVGRFEAAIGMDPKRILRARTSSFRRVGLSEAKAIAIKRVARAKIDGLFDRLKGKTDEQIRELLVAIKGIGPWTVDMVLMFGLARRDVWPIGDGGIQRAAREQYAVAPGPELDELGDRFRPYRSYAAWYLWRSLE